MTQTEAKTENISEILDRLISDYGPSKYEDIVWAMKWARHLRRQEEFRQVPMADMIEKAMLEVIGGKIKKDEIMAAVEKDQSIIDKLLDKKDELSSKKESRKKPE